MSDLTWTDPRGDAWGYDLPPGRWSRVPRATQDTTMPNFASMTDAQLGAVLTTMQYLVGITPCSGKSMLAGIVQQIETIQQQRKTA